MKYLLLLGDGMADYPLEALEGRTPLDAAATPAMDAVAQRGVCAQFSPIPEGYPPGSDVGNLAVFGYKPAEFYTGRAPLEAANQGIEVGAEELVFRCNLVTLEDGTMANFTAGHISSAEGAQLIDALNSALADLPVRFHPGVGYRHLAIVTASDNELKGLLQVKCTPPHDISDQPIADYLPGGGSGDVLRTIMERSQSVLQTHPVNAARVANGDPPGNSVWLWGQGVAPALPSYRERFGLTGAVISAVDLVKGIGRVAGLDVIDVPGATGYLDTDYAGKVEAALGALETRDFVYLHVEAPDETAHQGREDLKIQAIEDFDRHVVMPVLDYAQRQENARILVAPDHVTAISTRTHAAGPVPFAMCGTGIDANGARRYCETEAERFGLPFPEGHRLVPFWLTQPTIDAEALAGLGV
ncbi:MAG: cofactor-independent phosphoglycerate mutase [Candidatus Hydrogenedentota bacterium]